MENSTISIEISRKDHALHSVSAIIPVWHRNGADGKVYYKIPFLGIETYAENEVDADEAIREALACFCKASEKFGLGLESELEFMGWKRQEKSGLEVELMNIPSMGDTFDLVIETGEALALEVAL